MNQQVFEALQISLANTVGLTADSYCALGSLRYPENVTFLLSFVGGRSEGLEELDSHHRFYIPGEMQPLTMKTIFQSDLWYGYSRALHGDEKIPEREIAKPQEYELGYAVGKALIGGYVLCAEKIANGVGLSLSE